MAIQKTKETNTKEMILQTAIDMFSEKGFANVSMRDLAKKVGITSASIYNHFSSKDEIMNEIMQTCHLKSLKVLAHLDEPEIQKLVENKSFDDLVNDFFTPFNPEEAEQTRKMCKILLAEQFTHPKAIEFWRELAIIETGKRWRIMLDTMVSDGRLPKMNTLLASELLTRIAVTFVIQFAHYQNGEDSQDSLSMNSIHQYLFEKIKNGEIQ